MDLSSFNLQSFIIVMAVLILAITIHEFAHAITADRLGDPTPRQQGRISLLPPDHLDPLGTIMMVVTSITGFGIGWGKPVMTNPGNFQNPRKGSAIVAIAGPVSNLIQAAFFALVLRAIGIPSLSEGEALTPVGTFLVMGVSVNVALAFFNMIPLGPLDGHWVVQGVLPHDQAMTYRQFNDAYGGFIFLALVLMAPRVLWTVLGPAVNSIVTLLLPAMTF